VRRVLEGAARVVVFDESIGARVAAALPDLAARIVRVPQAVELPAQRGFDLEAAWPGLPGSRVLFAFPAGIRPVKRPLMPLAALDAVAARRPALRLLYAGPLIDPDAGEDLRAALATRAWARHVGTVPYDAMASLLAQADVVLNCSLSEGGMANSVLEAMACGRAVLAADIAGNRSLVAHDVSGLLFRDETELATTAERLVIDAALRARLGAAGRARVVAEFPPAREIEGYLAVYGALMPSAARRA
jgi:glycosyltransferase involved in cell wall biosynthesis